MEEAAVVLCATGVCVRSYGVEKPPAQSPPRVRKARACVGVSQWEERHQALVVVRCGRLRGPIGETAATRCKFE